MNVIQILLSKLYQEKKEKESLLEKLINLPSITQYEDSLKILKELSIINNSIILLSSYIPNETSKEEKE